MPTPDIADLYERYAPAVRRLIARLAPEADVDDLLAETFERVWLGLPTYEERGIPIVAWIYRIARARITDLARYNNRRPAVRLYEWSVTVAGPEPQVARTMTRLWIRELIQKHLEGTQQQVIWLRFVEDLSQAEVCQRLDITLERVKALQWRGIARLRMAIAPTDAPSFVAALAVAEEEVPQCSIEGCVAPVYTKGLCGHHHYCRKKRGRKRPAARAEDLPDATSI